MSKLTPQAIFFILLYALSYSGLWACVTALSSDMHPLMMVFMRTLVGLALVLPMFFKSGIRSLKTQHLPLNILRGILSISTVALTFFALTQLPLADTIAYSYLTPMFAIILAAFFLKEHLGAKQVIAICIAFLGAMLLLRPDFQMFNIGVVAAVGAALSFAGTLTCMKILTRHDSPKLVAAYGYIIPLPLSLAMAASFWQWPVGMEQWGMLVLIGLLSVIAQISMSQALFRADMGLLLPFDFVRLVFGAGLGVVLFQDRLDWLSFLGGTIILAASVFSSRPTIEKQKVPENKKRRPV